MRSIEQEVKEQFARVFTQGDWRLFKRMAEYYLEQAAFLRKADVRIDDDLRLLARNCQKRLFIGVAAELLMKALYLSSGFAVNKASANVTGTGGPKVPRFRFEGEDGTPVELSVDQTYTLSELIDGIEHIPGLTRLEVIRRGFRIAKVFRNKEAHVVYSRQAFEASNYRDIEQALVELYASGFGERLKVVFSLEWDVRNLRGRLARTLRAVSEGEVGGPKATARPLIGRPS